MFCLILPEICVINIKTNIQGIDYEKPEDVRDQKLSCTAQNFGIHANTGTSPKEWKDTVQFSAK